MDGRPWSESDVAEYLGVSLDTLQWIRSVNPTFPAPTPDVTTLQWQRADVDEWLDQLLDRVLVRSGATTEEGVTPDEVRSAIGRLQSFRNGPIAIHVNPADVEAFSSPAHRRVFEESGAVLVPSAEDAEPGEYWVSSW